MICMLLICLFRTEDWQMCDLHHKYHYYATCKTALNWFFNGVEGFYKFTVRLNCSSFLFYTDFRGSYWWRCGNTPSKGVVQLLTEINKPKIILNKNIKWNFRLILNFNLSNEYNKKLRTQCWSSDSIYIPGMERWLCWMSAPPLQEYHRGRVGAGSRADRWEVQPPSWPPHPPEQQKTWEGQKHHPRVWKHRCTALLETQTSTQPARKPLYTQWVFSSVIQYTLIKSPDHTAWAVAARKHQDLQAAFVQHHGKVGLQKEIKRGWNEDVQVDECQKLFCKI